MDSPGVWGKDRAGAIGRGRIAHLCAHIDVPGVAEDAEVRLFLVEVVVHGSECVASLTLEGERGRIYPRFRSEVITGCSIELRIVTGHHTTVTPNVWIPMINVTGVKIIIPRRTA